MQILRRLKKHIKFLSDTLVIVTIILSVTSCEGCNNSNADKNSSVDENSGVDEVGQYKLKLEGLNVDNTIPATNQFTLKVKKTDGSAIKAAEVTHIKVILTTTGDAKIASIGADNTLAFIDSDIQAIGIIEKKIKVIPGEQDTKFNLQLQQDGKNIGKPKIVECRNKTVVANIYTLTVTKGIIDDGNTEVKVTVDGTQELKKEDLEKLSLRIERTKGNNMTIDGASKDNSGYYNLAFDGAHKLQINNSNKKEAMITLKLIPRKDKKAELKLSLLDEKNNPITGANQIVKWTNGAKLELKNLNYNAGNKRIKGVIHNTGKRKLKANQASLHWNTGNGKVKIENLKNGSKAVASDIAPGESASFELENVIIDDLSTPHHEIKLKLKWDKLKKDEEGKLNIVVAGKKPYLYFEFLKEDLPFITPLLNKFDFPVIPIGIGEFNKIVKHPCILFSFKVLNARLDTDEWKDNIKTRGKAAGGNVVLVVMHNSIGYDTTRKVVDLGLPSGLAVGTDKYKSTVLEYVFDIKWDNTGMGENELVLAAGDETKFINEVNNLGKIVGIGG